MRCREHHWPYDLLKNIVLPGRALLSSLLLTYLDGPYSVLVINLISDSSIMLYLPRFRSFYLYHILAIYVVELPHIT